MRGVGWYRRRPDGRRRGGGSTAAVLIFALLAAGCSGVPTGGPAQDVRTVQSPPAPEAAPAPQNGQAPEVVIRGFITSSADNRSDQSANNSFAAARRYLTDRVAAAWNPQGVSVIIVADEYRTVRGDGDTFTVTGTQVGSLDVDRAYRALPGQQIQVPLRLVQVAGEWRIDSVPDQVLITETDFDNNYLERSLYFLNRTGTVLVPDLRYLPRGTSTAGRASRLVTMLLAGPSSALGTAATSRLRSGANLASNVTVDADDVAHVDLTDVGRVTGQAELALAAQVAWTLRSEGAGVQLSIDGKPIDPADPIYTPDSTSAFSPDSLPPGGRSAQQIPYYLDPAGRVISLDDGRAMWGSLGVSGRVVAADMSAATGTLAAVTRVGTQQELLVGRPLQFQQAKSVLTADTLSTPTFDRAGTEAWVVLNGGGRPQINRVTTGDQIARQDVAAPGLVGKGAVTALTLSPDGVRVAVVAGGVLYVGVIQQKESPNGGAPTLSVVGLSELDPELDDVGPVVFRSSIQLLVGAKAGTGPGVRTRTPQTVSIDGRRRDPVSSAGIVDDVTALAVGGDVTLAAFGGQVRKLTGSTTTGRWDPPLAGSPQLDGSAPFIPH